MAQLIYLSRAFADLERLTDFLLESEPAGALASIDLIAEAVAILANHSLIGRPAESGMRELDISRGKSGYLTLYSYEPQAPTVLILAVRHQREAGYDGESEE